jgi:hypothetical protein
VPVDDWPVGVDAREPHVTRKAAEKRLVAEGPSYRRKSTDPIGSRGPLITDDEKSSRK